MGPLGAKHFLFYHTGSMTTQKVQKSWPSFPAPMKAPSTGLVNLLPQLPHITKPQSSLEGWSGGVCPNSHWDKASNLHLQSQNPTAEIFISLMTRQGFMFSVAPAI